MPLKNQLLEFNTFVGGLNTEASPLTFPENSSLDEDNFVLDKNGSRRRRLGMDLQAGSSTVATTETPNVNGDISANYFEWENAGGIPQKSIGCIQVGNEVRFFDLDADTVTGDQIGIYVASLAAGVAPFGFASVDGLLVIATGLEDLVLAQYDSSGVTFSTFRLEIRDQFGVDAFYNGESLYDGNNVNIRPNSITGEHRYNLMNQTWDSPRKFSASSVTVGDCINRAKEYTGKYPSNADNLHLNTFPKTDSGSDPVTPRFYEAHFRDNPPSNSPAPRGFFIIDALDRGASRIKAQNDHVDKFSTLSNKVTSLPEDKSLGGAKTVAQYSGRIWYAGFSGSVREPDSRSPRMSSYVLFSKLVKDPSDLNVCYQVGDPTSTIDPDIVDTDGGFIKLDGAYNIQSMYDTGNSLIVLAENGVWAISGGTDTGFSATGYIVRKVSDHGTISPGSVVVVDNGLMYWSDDGIYHMAPNNYGDLSAQNISFQKVQTLYDGIDEVEKTSAKGAYDSFNRQVRWIYQNKLGSSKPTIELVLDLSLGAFFKHSINGDGTTVPKVVLPFNIPPYSVDDEVQLVSAGGDLVVVGPDQVILTSKKRVGATREVGYLTATSDSPSIEYGVSTYSSTEFKDWISLTVDGINYTSYLLTGYLPPADNQRRKQVGRLVTHLAKTEDGFVEDEDGNLIPTNPSGCLVQSQWEWTNSVEAGKWSKKFQVYRPKRHYIPSSASDLYEDGVELVTAKSKLRGRGRVVSLLFESEEGKDLQLQGWGLLLGVNQNV